MKRLLPLSVLVLAGCVAGYEAPSAGAPAATIDFDVSPPGTVAAPKVAFLREPAPGTCTDGRQVASVGQGNPMVATNNRDIRIAAGASTRLVAAMGEAYYSNCGAAFEWIPQDGAHYRVTLLVDGNRCTAKVERRGAGGWSDEPVTPIRC